MLIKQGSVVNLDTHHAIGTMYAGQVDLVHKTDKRRVLWVSASTFYFQTVYPAIIDSLQKIKDAGLAQSLSVREIRCMLSLRDLFPLCNHIF